MAEQKRNFTERRKGPDIVVKAVWWIIGISWALIIGAFLFTSEAQPRFRTFYDDMLKERVRSYVDQNLLRYAFYLLLANLAVCIIGVILNLTRNKRKTDKIHKSIIVLGAITLVGILWYLIAVGL